MTADGERTATAPAGGIGAGRMALIGVLFAVSGAAALIYQVAWQRILALQSGA